MSMPMCWSGLRLKDRAIKRESISFYVRFVMHRSNQTFERTNTGGTVRGFTEHLAPVFAAQRKR